MRSQKVMTLTRESIDKHHNWCIGRGQSENTARAYRSDLTGFLTATELSVVPMESFEDLAQYWLNQTRRIAAPRTTGRRLTSLRSFSKWAGWPDLLSDYVAPTPAKGQPHPIPGGLESLNRMLEVARNNEQKALVGLCGFAGLRVSESLSTGPDDFDLHEMRLNVRGKGDKSRVVPISPRAWSAVCSAYVDAVSRGHKTLIQYQDRSARKAITTLGARAGLARSISSHDLRATFATLTYDKTKDQRVVQELLGHANGSTTEIYIGITQAKMQSAVEF